MIGRVHSQEPDAIFEIIGDHWQGPLRGCAFEDLLTQELEPDGHNLVDGDEERETTIKG
ncbi:hypothetical protein [Sphingopyxis indica]|uniref:hypothetical protein n=1 Tax=Sphingopyxis indica TaxID=436663 RepID=UPI001483A39F|nr:hypothetical protein [Sphingopyxis indica]